MIGGVVGDFIGSEFEHKTLKTYNLLQLTSYQSKITDESVMLASVADALINNLDFADCIMKWGWHFSNIEYGPSTSRWLENGDIREQMNGYGNGAATRAGIIGMLDLPLSMLLELAEESAKCTHAHPEGIAGARAVVYCVWAVRNCVKKEAIYEYLLSEYGYLMFYTIEGLKKELTFDSSAENTVPVAIFLALESKDWDDCIRLCLYAAGGGDTDSIMSMASLIKSQTHSIDEKYLKETKRWLFKNAQPVLQMIQEFEVKRLLCRLPC